MGDDDDEPEFSSAVPLEEGDTFIFAPRPLRNLVLVDELESLSPILGSHIADLGEQLQKSYALATMHQSRKNAFSISKGFGTAMTTDWSGKLQQHLITHV